MKREYNVILTAEDIENGIVKAVAEKARTFKMSGFRAGHVPLNVVRNNVEDSVISNVFDSLISNACNEIVKDLKVTSLALKPVYRFENKYEKGKDAKLTVTIEIAPAFDLKPYDIEMTKIVPDVNDEDVSNEIKRIISFAPIYAKAEADYVVKPLDAVAYRAVCHNNKTGKQEKSFNNKVIIPSNIPEDAKFLAGFIGTKAGDVYEFSPPEEKDLTYKIHIKSVEKALIDISPEEYAQKRGFKSLDEFKSAVRTSLENEIGANAFIYHKNQVLETLVKQYDFKLPQGIVDNEMKNVVADVKRELEKEQKKHPESKVEKKSEEEIRKEYADVVNKKVLLGYVLNKIAQKENITATNEEVSNAIQIEIERNPRLRDALIDYYSKNEGAIAYKKAEIIEYKVVSFLIGKAKTNEVKKTKTEVDKIVKELLEE